MRTVVVILLLCSLGCGAVDSVEPEPIVDEVEEPTAPPIPQNPILAEVEPGFVPEEQTFSVEAAEKLVKRIGRFKKSGQISRFTLFKPIPAPNGFESMILAIHCGKDGNLIRAVAYVEPDTYEVHRDNMLKTIRSAMMLVMDDVNPVEVAESSELLQRWFEQAFVQGLMSRTGGYWIGNEKWKAFAFTTYDDKKQGLMIYPATSEQPRMSPFSLADVGVVE